MGGLLERRALIIHICSGDVRLMPELKRDRVLRGEQLIRSGGGVAENSNFGHVFFCVFANRKPL